LQRKYLYQQLLRIPLFVHLTENFLLFKAKKFLFQISVYSC
jgi:hypothetical protein